MQKLFLFSASLLSLTNAIAQDRPNIILFLVDDMGWEDTSVPFWTERTNYNNIYETPNMERLASQGMLFTQAYACSVSSPSRCSLLTGANNARHRVTNWTMLKDTPTDLNSEIVNLPQWNYNGISPVDGTDNTFTGTSFVKILHEHDYFTIHCGKAHFGAKDTPGEDPLNWGFDVNIAGHAAGGLATYFSEKNYGHDADGKPYALNAIPGLEKYWQTGIFATEALTLEAIRTLDSWKGSEKPFYLYMSHYAIHIPIDKDPRFYQKYIDKGLTSKEAAYASLIEGMDKSLGDLMDWLEKNDQADNTIVMFLSDNGGLATQPEWRDGPLYTQNSPLDCGKGSLHEGGIRVPMIVKWPGKVREASTSDHYLMIEDFYPTILEMAGITNYSTKNQIDGISFLPMLFEQGDTSINRPLFWNFPNIWGNEGPGINLNCAVRLGDWKLVYYWATGFKELFNIKEDIGEKKNIATLYPEKVEELSRILGNYLRKVKADRPVFKDGKPCPWPDAL